jgi:hypothetical protein
MSKARKPKKLRRPNIPMAVGPTSRTTTGAGLEVGRETTPSRSEPAPVTFNYTHIKKDLTRIGLLAGSFIAILVVLSFIIK